MSKKCTLGHNERIFQNVNGKNIKLKINSHVAKACIEFIIEDVTKEHFERNLTALLLFIMFNLVFLFCNFISQSVFSLLLIIAGCIVKQLLMKVKNESVLLIKSFGIQYTVSYYFGSFTTQFIPLDIIDKVFINEVVTLQRVLYFLTIMTRETGNERVIPLFKYTKPRLKCLEIIYRYIDEVCS